MTVRCPTIPGIADNLGRGGNSDKMPTQKVCGLSKIGRQISKSVITQ